MEKERLHYLLQQRNAEKATPEEEQELSALLRADTHKDLFQSVVADMMQQETAALPGNQAPWQKMVQDIVKIDKSLPEKATITQHRIFQIYRWTAAAAVLLIAGAIYFFANRASSPATSGPANTIPALVTAPSIHNQLTLSDGSQILLDEVKNGVIATLDNITVTKKDQQLIYTSSGPADEAVYHVLSTARGSHYEIVLADGSRVSLNAASSLRFPGVFSGAQRSVELSGEAWFDVHHADRLPFSIHSGQLTTTVLGTAFDIKAYPGQNIMTVAVQRGKVRVDTPHKTLATLEKGQQVKITADSIALVQRIDTLLVGGWKQGNLNYEDEQLQNIVADLQRVFADSISIQSTAIKEIRITGRYHKKDGLQKILTMICNLGDCRLTKKNGIFILE